jgi:hypothetical protein
MTDIIKYFSFALMDFSTQSCSRLLFYLTFLVAFLFPSIQAQTDSRQTGFYLEQNLTSQIV